MIVRRIVEQVRRLAEALAAYHRRQPLLAVMALFLSGIVFGFHFGGMAVAAVGALVCGAAWAVLARRGSSLWMLARVGTIVLAGWGLAAREREGRAEEARRFGELAPKQVFVCRVGQEAIQTPLKGQSAKVIFKGERFRTEDGTFACVHMPVNVTWFGLRDSPDAPHPGEVWHIKGKGKIRTRRGSGLPYLEINTGEGRAERLAEAGVSSWRARVDRARRKAARRVVIGIESWGDIPALNQAMLLGSRHEMPPAMKRVFVDSGTIHVFAISGLHIVLVAAVLTLAVSVLGVPRMYWLWAVGPPLIFYTVMTGSQPSAVRACVMGLVYFVAPLIGRKPSGMAALAGSALVLHAIRPSLIYDVGSVLSFTVMAGLVVFCQPFCNVGRRLCRVGWMENEVTKLRLIGDAAGARRWGTVATAVKWTADSFAVSLAAWLASVPLTAYYFGRFTPGGLFANLLAGPCSLFIVVAGCLGVAASFVSDWLAACFNHAAGFFTWVMVKTAEVTVACPGSNFRIAKWTPWLVWAWFVVLLVVAVRLRTRRPSDGMAWMSEK